MRGYVNLSNEPTGVWIRRGRREYRKNGDGTMTMRDTERTHWEAKGYSRLHYFLESSRHTEFYDKVYPTPEEATKIISKFKRHFKIAFTYSFNNRNTGRALSGGLFRSPHIELPYKDISLGLICHEVAHLMAHKKWGYKVHHNKKFQTQCNRACRWAKKFLEVKELPMLVTPNGQPY